MPGLTAARFMATANCTTICVIRGNRFARTGSPGWRPWPESPRRLATGVVPVGMAASLPWSRQTPWTDITYIKTHEGWLYLSVIIDLFSRRVVGWSAQSRMTTDLALQALLAAVWRRKPKHRVMIHSDQGSQFTSREWQTFLRQHNLDASLSLFASKQLPVQHEPPRKLS